jgi:hypothetical protein
VILWWCLVNWRYSFIERPHSYHWIVKHY